MLKKLPNTFWLVVFIALLSILKLYLVADQTFSSRVTNIHDETLYVHLASEIIKGNWLGNYDAATLTKRSFFPLWIAFVHFLHLPLMLANHLLYILACIVFIISIRPILNNNIAGMTVLYSILLFNPYSYSHNLMLRVLRENIYPALTILVVASAIALLIRREANRKITTLWGILLGCSLAAFWLTREDSLWILPFLLFLGFSLLICGKNKIWQSLKIILAPAIICWLLISAFALMNLIKYGVFTTWEPDTKEFKSVYRSFLRIKSEKPRFISPLDKTARTKAIEFSPSLKELDPYFCAAENTKGGYTTNGGEIKGFVFEQFFRRFVEEAGHYHSAQESLRFYQKIADEINWACNAKKLDCSAENSLFPKLMRDRYLKYFPSAFKAIAKRMLNFENLDPFPRKIIEQENIYYMDLFQEMTGRKNFLSDKSTLTVDELTEQEQKKFSILESVGKRYQEMIVPLTILALIAYLFLIYSTFFRKQNVIDFIIATSVLLALLSRIAVVAVLKIEFSRGSDRFLAAAYPLLLLFIAFTLIKMVLPWCRRESQE